MPVSLSLNSEQYIALEAALKGKDIVELKPGVRSVHVTVDNLAPIRDALKTYHQKKYRVKTKTAAHLETCFFIEQVLNKLNEIQKIHFPEISTSEEKSSEALEELTRQSEELGLYEDDAPPLDTEWFENAKRSDGEE